MQVRFQLQRDHVLRDIFREYDGPNFSLRFQDGWEWTRAPGLSTACTIIIATRSALHRLLATPNGIALGAAFVRGELDVEGDIFRVFDVAEYLLNRPRSAWERTLAMVERASYVLGQTLRQGLKHSRKRNSASISFHYDQPVEFYRPWLGETLAYSCAYFRSPDEPLDQAQRQKLELICRKLRVKPGEKFLDIGCGWGSLVLHAATQHEAQAHGITLSKRQHQVAERRIEAAGLENQCRVELRDYRDCKSWAGMFDKIASVGMYEHVGLANLSSYFRAALALLKPGGTFLNHGIARSCSSPPRDDSFIDRCVFPDGRLVTLSQAVDRAEEAGFEVRDAENLREHYELTLRHWVEGLRRHADELRNHVSGATYRTWLLYMAGCAAAFRRGEIAVYQLLLSRPERGRSGMPLVREDWYKDELPRSVPRVTARAAASRNGG